MRSGEALYYGGSERATPWNGQPRHLRGLDTEAIGLGRNPMGSVEKLKGSTDILHRRSWRPRWEPLEPN